MQQPTPVNREVTFDAENFIVSKTDTKGRIIYGNELFIEISGYTEQELLGSPHNILRHPDMPKVVFKLLWDYIQRGEEIFAYVKNMTKEGAYYWVHAYVTPMYDETGRCFGYHSVRRKPTPEALRIVGPLYAQLLEAEKRGGLEASEKLLNDILKEKKVTYGEFSLAFS